MEKNLINHINNIHIYDDESSNRYQAIDLPNDIVTRIFEYLDYKSLGKTVLSNKKHFGEIYLKNLNNIKARILNRMFKQVMEEMNTSINNEDNKKFVCVLQSIRNCIEIYENKNIYREKSKIVNGKKVEVADELVKEISGKLRNIRNFIIGNEDPAFLFKFMEKLLPPFKIKNLTIRTCDNFKSEIPEGVKELKLDDCYNFQSKIPKSIEVLKIRGCTRFQSIISESVEILEMVDCYEFQSKIPKNIKQLIISRCNEVQHNIPEGVKKLVIHGCHKFEHNIPEGVKKLVINACPNFQSKIPKSVKILKIKNSHTFQSKISSNFEKLSLYNKRNNSQKKISQSFEELNFKKSYYINNVFLKKIIKDNKDGKIILDGKEFIISEKNKNLYSGYCNIL